MARRIRSLYIFNKGKGQLIEYVKNQEEHHKTKTFLEEYVELLKEHGIEYEEKYLS